MIKTNELETMIANTQGALKKFEKEYGHFVEVNGIRLHYLEWPGPAGAPTIIWINGGHSSAYELIDFAPSWVEAGYRVVSVDARGHGKTQISDFDFTIYEIADDIIALMDVLGIKTAIVGGWSLGGAVAAAIYDDYRDRIEALILEDGGFLTTQRAWDVLAQFRKKIGDDRRLFKGPNHPGNEPYDSLEDFLKDIVVETQKAGLSTFSMNFLMMLASLEKQGEDGKWIPALDADRIFGPLGENTEMSSFQRPLTVSIGYFLPRKVFRRLSRPVLLLAGDSPLQVPEGFEDPFVEDLSDARWMAETFPELVRLCIYSGVGHTVKMERPEEFNRDVLNFLASL